MKGFDIWETVTAVTFGAVCIATLAVLVCDNTRTNTASKPTVNCTQQNERIADALADVILERDRLKVENDKFKRGELPSVTR
jgi:hypothetical protein